MSLKTKTMNSLSPLSQFTADDTSADLFRQVYSAFVPEPPTQLLITLPSRSNDSAILVQKFVPVQQMGFNDLAFQDIPSSAQFSAADGTSLPNKEHHLCSSPAQISSPFSSSEAAHTNTFVPMDIKADQVSKNGSVYGEHVEYSSGDGEQFVYEETAEVSSCFTNFSSSCPIAGMGFSVKLSIVVVCVCLLSHYCCLSTGSA